MKSVDRSVEGRPEKTAFRVRRPDQHAAYPAPFITDPAPHIMNMVSACNNAAHLPVQ